MNKINIELNTLPINNDFEKREALSDVTNFVETQMGNVYSFETRIIKENFLSTYQELISVLEGADSLSDKFKLDTVSFTLTVDVSGKISLLSTIGGNSNQKTGITITLKPKNG